MTSQELLSKLQSELSETSNPATPFVTADRVLDSAVRLLKEHGCQYRQQVIDAAKTAYDQFVRPFDIPGIPNIIEPKVDDVLGDLLVTSLERVAARLCDGDDTEDKIVLNEG